MNFQVFGDKNCEAMSRQGHRPFFVSFFGIGFSRDAYSLGREKKQAWILRLGATISEVLGQISTLKSFQAV